MYSLGNLLTDNGLIVKSYKSFLTYCPKHLLNYYVYLQYIWGVEWSKLYTVRDTSYDHTFTFVCLLEITSFIEIYMAGICLLLIFLKQMLLKTETSIVM